MKLFGKKILYFLEIKQQVSYENFLLQQVRE